MHHVTACNWETETRQCSVVHQHLQCRSLKDSNFSRSSWDTCSKFFYTLRDVYSHVLQKELCGGCVVWLRFLFWLCCFLTVHVGNHNVSVHCNNLKSSKRFGMYQTIEQKHGSVLCLTYVLKWEIIISKGINLYIFSEGLLTDLRVNMESISADMLKHVCVDQNVTQELTESRNFSVSKLHWCLLCI